MEAQSSVGELVLSRLVDLREFVLPTVRHRDPWCVECTGSEPSGMTPLWRGPDETSGIFIWNYEYEGRAELGIKRSGWPTSEPLCNGNNSAEDLVIAINSLEINSSRVIIQ